MGKMIGVHLEIENISRLQKPLTERVIKCTYVNSHRHINTHNAIISHNQDRSHTVQSHWKKYSSRLHKHIDC